MCEEYVLVIYTNVHTAEKHIHLLYIPIWDGKSGSHAAKGIYMCVILGLEQL